MQEKSNEKIKFFFYNFYFRAATVEEKEQELRPSSADAGTEYSIGFLLWSYMTFGAENALVGVIFFFDKKIFS